MLDILQASDKRGGLMLGLVILCPSDNNDDLNGLRNEFTHTLTIYSYSHTHIYISLSLSV